MALGIIPGAWGLYRIIVGVGVSFVPSNKSSVDDIVVISRWPNHQDHTWKAPTTIAYAAENQQKLNRNHWGFEVTHGLKQYAWTKLLLDKDVDMTQFDDPSLREMYGDGFLKLPHGKTAQDVTEDYLRELYKFTVQKLEQELGSAVFRTMPMEVWITYPAIWSVKATEATKAAAKAAGFGSRPSDTFNMITEPEAAALVAMKPHLGLKAIDPVQSGECFLICDCGGGTVDIITYVVTRTNPVLKYKEICRGMGGKCGSTYIDRNFVQWMTRQFGNAYTRLDLKKRGPGSRFMNAFESAKRNFGSSDDDRVIEIGPLDMEVPYSPKYDDDEQAVKLSKNDMASLFDPSMRELTRLVDTQVNLAKQKGKKIDRFILVGGFGDSAYLNRVIKEWCTRNGVKRFTCPEHCQAAIVKGAALRGLEGIRPTNTIARYHYGWSWGMPFRDGIDDEKHSYICDFSSMKMCSNRMYWPIRKGQELDESTFESVEACIVKKVDNAEQVSKLRLYQCGFADPPEREDHYSVQFIGCIETKFTDVNDDIVSSRWNSRLGRMVHQYDFNLQIYFRSHEGALKLRSMAYGKERGTTKIDCSQS